MWRWEGVVRRAREGWGELGVKLLKKISPLTWRLDIPPGPRSPPVVVRILEADGSP